MGSGYKTLRRMQRMEFFNYESAECIFSCEFCVDCAQFGSLRVFSCSEG